MSRLDKSLKLNVDRLGKKDANTVEASEIYDVSYDEYITSVDPLSDTDDEKIASFLAPVSLQFVNDAINDALGKSDFLPPADNTKAASYEYLLRMIDRANNGETKYGYGAFATSQALNAEGVVDCIRALIPWRAKYGVGYVEIKCETDGDVDVVCIGGGGGGGSGGYSANENTKRSNGGSGGAGADTILQIIDPGTGEIKQTIDAKGGIGGAGGKGGADGQPGYDGEFVQDRISLVAGDLLRISIGGGGGGGGSAQGTTYGQNGTNATDRKNGEGGWGAAMAGTNGKDGSGEDNGKGGAGSKGNKYYGGSGGVSGKIILLKALLSDNPSASLSFGADVVPMATGTIWQNGSEGLSYIPGVKIMLSCPSEPEAVVHYTTDGSLPTINSTKQTGVPIMLIDTMTIKAVAVKDDMYISDIFEKEYKIALLPLAQIKTGTIQTSEIPVSWSWPSLGCVTAWPSWSLFSASITPSSSWWNGSASATAMPAYVKGLVIKRNSTQLTLDTASASANTYTFKGLPNGQLITFEGVVTDKFTKQSKPIAVTSSATLPFPKTGSLVLSSAQAPAKLIIKWGNYHPSTSVLSFSVKASGTGIGFQTVTVSATLASATVSGSVEITGLSQGTFRVTGKAIDVFGGDSGDKDTSPASATID
jgi:hypothetical protein